MNMFQSTIDFLTNCFLITSVSLLSIASLTPAVDIYAFGMCALEMAALEIQGNGDSGTLVTDEHIQRTIDSLEDDQQKDFIQKCLHEDPTKRATARDLLFHSLLFEVHSLKLLAAHSVVKTARKQQLIAVHSYSY